MYFSGFSFYLLEPQEEEIILEAILLEDKVLLLQGPACKAFKAIIVFTEKTQHGHKRQTAVIVTAGQKYSLINID